MAVGARESLTEALRLPSDFSKEGFDRVVKLEDESDRYEDTIGTYLMKITLRELDAQQNAEVSEFLHTLPDFEPTTRSTSPKPRRKSATKKSSIRRTRGTSFRSCGTLWRKSSP